MMGCTKIVKSNVIAVPKEKWWLLFGIVQLYNTMFSQHFWQVIYRDSIVYLSLLSFKFKLI